MMAGASRSCATGVQRSDEGCSVIASRGRILLAARPREREGWRPIGRLGGRVGNPPKADKPCHSRGAGPTLIGATIG